MESFKKQTSANICVHGWPHIVAYLSLNNRFDSVGLPFCAQLTCVSLRAINENLFQGCCKHSYVKTNQTKSYLNFGIG